MDKPNGASSPPTLAPPPPEIEATLQRLSAYRNVRGVMILARGAGGSGIVQSTGAVFEGESGRRYAGALENVVTATAAAVGAVDEGVSFLGREREGNEADATPCLMRGGSLAALTYNSSLTLFNPIPIPAQLDTTSSSLRDVLQDELRLMRIRTRRHELIITPGKSSGGHAQYERPSWMA